MIKLALALCLGLVLAGSSIGCHASGHADDSGVGADVHTK